MPPTSTTQPSTTKGELIAAARSLALHPLTRRWAQKTVLSGDNTIHTASDVLAERCVRLAGTLGGCAMGELTHNLAAETVGAHLMALAGTAIRAEPYLWTHEVREQLQRLKVPSHRISPRMMNGAHAMWWTYESAVDVGDASIDCLAVVDGGDRVILYSFGELHEPRRPFLEVLAWRYGHEFVSSTTREVLDARLADVVVSLAFLGSPFIPREVARLSRSERREIARVGAADVGETATFIVLRRPQGAAQDGGTGDGRYHHRWIVSGHLRAQWYPSEQAHHLIWIAPHVKGPTDAPLLSHVYKVSR